MASEQRQHGDEVEVRAFRGTRRSSVYRSHLLSAKAFARIRAAGERKGFPLLSCLSSLGQSGHHDLNKKGAREMADEATSIRSSGDLPELDDDLTAIAEVARWCARASDDSWMKIEGQTSSRRTETQ
jgi:hypothetical protein